MAKYKVFVPLGVFEEAEAAGENTFFEQCLTICDEDGMTFQAVLKVDDHAVLGAMFEFTSKKKAVPLMMAGAHNALPPNSEVCDERHTLSDTVYEATEEDE
jgi:hypothetical protein